MLVHYLNSLTPTVTSSDILDVATFSLEEGIKGLVCLDKQPSSDVKARFRLTGTVSLDTTATLSHYGSLEIQHRPIDSRKVLDIVQDVSITSDTVPFFLDISTVLSETFQLPSSLRVGSSNLRSDLEIGHLGSHYLNVAVSYSLELSLVRNEVEEEKFMQEIRLVGGPSTTLDCLSPIKEACIQEAAWKHNLLTPAFRKISHHRADSDDGLSIEVAPINPLVFASQSDIASSKLSFKVSRRGSADVDRAPAQLRFTVSWNLQSSTDIKIDDAEDEYRESSLELYKTYTCHKRRWESRDWTNEIERETRASVWTTEQDLWLTVPLGSWLTPTFHTPYLSQTYSLHLQIKAKETGKFNGRQASFEFDLPISLAYDQGTVPNYAIGNSPPEYVQCIERAAA